MMKRFQLFLNENECFCIYGAGKIGQRLFCFLKERGKKVDAFVVTCAEGNPEQIDGVPVIPLEEMDGCEDIALIIAVAGSPARILEKICDHSFRSTFYATKEVADKIAQEQLFEKYRNASIFPNEEIHDVQPGFYLVNDKNRQVPFAMVPGDELSQNKEGLQEKCTVEALSRLCGMTLYLSHHDHCYTSAAKLRENGIEIYTAVGNLDSLRITALTDAGRIPLRVGADFAGGDSKIQCDNTGDHISGRNREYSECTGLYWIWKNTSGQKYVGQEHYRRRMMLDDHAVDTIISEDLDAVLSLPYYSLRSVKERFLDYIPDSDWKLLKEELITVDPAYEDLFVHYEKQGFIYPCNIALMKRPLFDRYCEFAFGLTERIYQHYRNKGWNRNDRYMGYLFENLETLFFMRHKDEYKLAYTELHWIE